jgi:Family of unknown function (DUF5683)
MRIAPTLLFPLLFVFQIGYAQQPDTAQATPLPQRDSIAPGKKKLKLAVKPDTLRAAAPVANNDSIGVIRTKSGFFHRFFVKKYPNPRAAALLSFVFPGAGQVYNKKWWKLPIVYGALGGMTWLALDNNNTYKALRNNYKWVVDGDDNTNPTEQPYVNMSASQLKTYRDQFRGFTEKSFLFLGITYLLQVTDAFVDAHLATFDVSDDLSLRVVPDIQSGGGGFGASFGIGIKLGFGNASKSAPMPRFSFTAP